MATARSYGNMLNQKPTTKTPLKEKPTESVWAKMLAKKGVK